MHLSSNIYNYLAQELDNEGMDLLSAVALYETADHTSTDVLVLITPDGNPGGAELRWYTVGTRLYRGHGNICHEYDRETFTAVSTATNHFARSVIKANS